MDQEFEAMRKQVCAYYYPYHETLTGWPDDTNALRLLREVVKRVGFNVQMTVTPDEYVVWVSNYEGVVNGMHEAETLGEAAIRCAYAMIGEK